MSTASIVIITVLAVVAIGTVSWCIVNMGKEPETKVSEEDLYITKDTLLQWIYSCHEIKHLELCREAVDTFLLDRFAGHIHPDVFGKVMYQINAAMAHIRKSLA